MSDSFYQISSNIKIFFLPLPICDILSKSQEFVKKLKILIYYTEQLLYLNYTT